MRRAAVARQRGAAQHGRGWRRAIEAGHEQLMEEARVERVTGARRVSRGQRLGCDFHLLHGLAGVVPNKLAPACAMFHDNDRRDVEKTSDTAPAHKCAHLIKVREQDIGRGSAHRSQAVVGTCGEERCARGEIDADDRAGCT